MGDASMERGARGLGGGSIQPTAEDFESVLRFKYRDLSCVGWGPRLRRRYKYYTPDEVYEALVMRLVQGKTWLDVGCGRDVFPNNRPLARFLAERCQLLVGVDCDDTLDENVFVHKRVKKRVEDYHADRTFDVVTLRMVVEHIAAPEAVLTSLARLTRPGSLVVVYTINRWSPVSLLAWLIPFRFHHAIKHWFWGTEEKDTFPVVYKMNTRSALARLFEGARFQEVHFGYLDDCRTLSRFRWGHHAELFGWRFCRSLNLQYPENCLLGVYRRA